MAVQQFLLDGKEYNVDVVALIRKFSVLDTDLSGRTQDGEMYRDIIGTFYNYTMTVQQRGDDAASLDAFWDEVSKPVASHTCVFPYNQTTLSQKMYVTSGEQEIRRKSAKKTDWKELTINFIATKPKVTP